MAKRPGDDERTAQTQTHDAGVAIPRADRAPLLLFIILGGLTALGPLSTDMYVPALPEITTDLATTPPAVQLSLTACVVGLALGQLLIGPLSDIVGRRKPLLVGLAIYVAVSAAAMLATDPTVFITLRFVQGVAGAAGLVISRAVVRDRYDGAYAARLFSSLILVTGLAPVLAPVIGGLIQGAVGWTGVFAALAVAGLLLLAVTVFGLRESLPQARRSPAALGSTWRTSAGLVGDPTFWRYTLVSGLAFGGMFAYVSGGPFILQNVYGISPQGFGLIFAVNSLGMVVASQLNGWLVTRHGVHRLLAVGMWLTAAAGLGVLVSTVSGLGLAGLLPAFFAFMCGVGVVVPNTTALVMNAYPDSAGTASALFGAFQFVIAAVAPPLAGVAGEHAVLPTALLVAAAGLLLPVADRLIGSRTAER